MSISSSHTSLRFATAAVAFSLVLSLAGLPARTHADASSTPPSGQTASSTPSQDTNVSTGDASAGSGSQNTVNTNVVNTNATSTAPVQTSSSTPSSDTGGTASSTPPTSNASSTPPTNDASSTPSTLAASSTPATTDASSTPPAATSTDPTGGSSGPVSVTANNTASTTNDTSASAGTGSNTSGGNGSSSVSTGNAYATASAFNVINTNIVDSSGIAYFQDFFNALGIDLRGLNLSYFTTPGSGSSDLSVNTTNTADATSTVSVTASTGDNTASSTGPANIDTGNAYASGNSVNLVNSNIIRSNYLLVALNNFGNMNGDIVLPDAAFFKSLFANSPSVGGNTSVSADNTAVVTSNTSATASTGGNTASSTGGSANIGTGNALSSATSFNQVNSNLVGGSTVFFLFRIWGNWNGTVQGLPAGMTWQNTPSGIEITNADGQTVSPGQLSQSTCATCGSSLNATTTDTAHLASNVHVYALTGGNEAQSASSSASINTGNAYAAADSVNVVNTNILGHNWIFAIFNIFGNLNGDIAFGHPDLWIGASAKAGNPTLPGAPVAFTFTVANRGDAEATHVRLSTKFLDHMLLFKTGTSTASGDYWDLGTFKPGQTKDFTFTAQAGGLPQGQSMAVPVTASVTSDQTDNNPKDNSDQLTLIVTNPVGPGGTESFTSDPKITVTKTADDTATTAPAQVGYHVDIQNHGGPAYDAVATDVLTGPSGQVMSRQSWNLDTLNYNDEIRINYGVQFGGGLPAGVYTNTVTVTGYKHYASGPGQVAMTPVSATNHLTLMTPTAAACGPLLTSYLQPGTANDSGQVAKLQQFLEGQGYGSVQVTGTYDAATIAAVKQFQQKYASDILGPWGYDKPTGNVYYTTEQKINDLWCSGRRSFGLSQPQLDEIAKTKSLIASLQQVRVSTVHTSAPAATSSASTTDVTLPPNVEIGMATTTYPEDPHQSWMQRFFKAQKDVMASVMNAFSSAVGGVAIR